MASLKVAKKVLEEVGNEFGGGVLIEPLLTAAGRWRRGQFKLSTVYSPTNEWQVLVTYAETGHDFGPNKGLIEVGYKIDQGIMLWPEWNERYISTQSKAKAEARKFAASLRKAIGMELRMMFWKACRKCVGHEPPFRSQAELKRVANAMVKVLKG